jgi:hypothetical protein
MPTNTPQHGERVVTLKRPYRLGPDECQAVTDEGYKCQKFVNHDGLHYVGVDAGTWIEWPQEAPSEIRDHLARELRDIYGDALSELNDWALDAETLLASPVMARIRAEQASSNIERTDHA